jgi:hypothetical protein
MLHSAIIASSSLAAAPYRFHFGLAATFLRGNEKPPCLNPRGGSSPLDCDNQTHEAKNSADAHTQKIDIGHG